MNHRQSTWLLPIAILAAGTILIRVFELDLAVAQAVFSAGGGAFLPKESGFSGLLYRAAPWPGVLLGVTALMLLVLSLASGTWRVKRRCALVLLGTLILGPGLIVNVALKDHFGRPRPRQIDAFGGAHTFRPVLEPGPGPEAHSFPSGHAAIAYYLGTPFFVLRRGRRALAFSFLGMGLGWGTLIGIVRILQGGHWLSDVVWAGSIVYFTAWVLSRACGCAPEART